MRYNPWKNDPDWKTTPPPMWVDVKALSQKQLKEHEVKVRWEFADMIERACLTQTATSCKACDWRPSKKPEWVWDALIRNTRYGNPAPNVTLDELREEYKATYAGLVTYAEEVRAHFATHKNVATCKCGKVHKNAAAAKKHESTIVCKETYRNVKVESQGYKMAKVGGLFHDMLDLIRTRHVHILGFVEFEDEETIDLLKQERNKAIKYVVELAQAKRYLTQYVVNAPSSSPGNTGWQEVYWLPNEVAYALEVLSKYTEKRTDKPRGDFAKVKEWQERQTQTALDFLMADQEEKDTILGCLELQLHGMQ